MIVLFGKSTAVGRMVHFPEGEIMQYGIGKHCFGGKMAGVLDHLVAGVFVHHGGEFILDDLGFSDAFAERQRPPHRVGIELQIGGHVAFGKRLVTTNDFGSVIRCQFRAVLQSVPDGVGNQPFFDGQHDYLVFGIRVKSGLSSPQS